MKAGGYVPAWASRRLARALGTPPGTGPLEVVAAGVRERGVVKTAESLETPFAFWCETAEGDVVAARDAFGCAPLAWRRQDDGRIAMSTDLEDLVRDDSPIDLGSVADFAQFEYLPRVERTLFQDVRMVPQGHVLIARQGRADRVELAPYTGLQPVDVPSRAHDLVDGFWSRFADACEAQADGQRVAVALSGGLDSTLIAAALKERGVEFIAVTAAYSVHDEELPLTRAVADHLGIDLEIVVVDEVDVFADWVQRSPRAVYPPADWYPTHRRVEERARARGAQGLFFGYGGDPLFVLEGDTGRALLRRRGVRGALEILRSRALHGVRPGLRRSTAEPWKPSMPEWASPVLRAAAEPELDEPPDRFGTTEGLRVGGLQSTLHPLWPWMFENQWNRNLPGSRRFPFFARGVVEYALSVPHLPWCVSKELLRAVARTRLPEAVCSRPKTSLARWRDRQVDARGLAGVHASVARAHEIVKDERLTTLEPTDVVSGVSQDDWLAMSVANWWSARKSLSESSKV